MEPEDRDRILRLAVRHYKLLGKVALLSALISAAVALVLPSSYVATVRLLPPQQNQSLALLFMGGSSNSPLASVAQKDLGLKNPADLYIGLLNSRSLQDALLQKFDLNHVYRMSRASDARDELARRTRIQFTKEGLLAVSVEDRDASRAAALANGYADALHNLTRHLAIGEAAERRAFYDDQVQAAKQDLQTAESRFRTVQQNTGILEIDWQAKVLIETAASLRGQIAAGEVELRGMRSFGTEQNPEVQHQEARLVGWRAELTRLESQRSSDPIFSKGRAPEQDQEYLGAMRELRYREAVLEMLMKQAEAAKLDEAKEATVIQVVDTAVPPDRRSSPQRTAIVLFGVVGALLATLLLLSGYESYRSSPEWQKRWSQICSERRHA